MESMYLQVISIKIAIEKIIKKPYYVNLLNITTVILILSLF